MSEHTVIAVDLAKTVFEVAESDRPGRVRQRRRVGRNRLLPLLGEYQPATVVMEAAGTASYWGRQFQALGHRVVLLPPQHVKSYRRGDKTDRNDAKALLEAFRNEDLCSVPVKTEAQQSLCFLHRLRSSWQKTRKSRLNAMRGLLREFGLTIPVGARHVLPAARGWLCASISPIPAVLHPALFALCEEIGWLEEKMRECERELRRLARQMPAVHRLMTVPGIGLLTATALVGQVVDIQRFATGRRFASFLGLVPREHSSGLSRKMGGISKRGNGYARTLVIHGARSVLQAAHRYNKKDRLSQWACGLAEKRGHNKAVVAVANKLARIVWAVWREERNYELRGLPQAA